MRITILYLLTLLLLAGCTSMTGGDKGIIGEGLGEELVVDKTGRIIGHPTRLQAPDKFFINSGKPTEREIRLLGVEGLSKEQAPITFAKAQEWLYTYVRNEQEIFIKPGIGTNLSDYVIYGLLYLTAADPITGEPTENYVFINQAMLSQGLVRIRDINEIKSPKIRERLKDAQQHAKREKLGLWSSNP